MDLTPKQTPKIFNAVNNIKYARHKNIKDTSLQEGLKKVKVAKVAHELFAEALVQG